MLKYDPQVILIDDVSTQLNEAAVTASKLIVYHDSMFNPLTVQAAKLLSKRAIVCGSKDQFMKALMSCLEGDNLVPGAGDNEFAKKYCIFEGRPRQNIEKELLNILDGI